MGLAIQKRFVDTVTTRLPWLPRKAVVPLSLALVFAPISVLAFSYGPIVSVQPESGTLSGGTTAVADASASGGQSVKFGTAGASTCSTKPDATNTGPSGTLTTDNRSSLSTANEVIENKTFPGDIAIYADGVELRNVHVNGDILINEANGVVIDHVSTSGVGVSSASDTTIQYARVNAYEDDSFHLTSDGASYISNVTIEHSFIDRPTFEPGSESHWDGVQIRGAENVTIFCNNFDVGEWQDPYNVIIYLEPANGNNDNIIVDNNWLNGGNFAFMSGLPKEPVRFSITNNKLYSEDFNFGLCYLGGGYTPTNLADVIQTGNTLDGAPIARVCNESDI
jgi:hypothetical protein